MASLNGFIASKIWESLESRQATFTGYDLKVLEQRVRRILPQSLNRYTTGWRDEVKQHANWQFDADKASQLLSQIDFPDFIQHLQQYGYKETKRKFMERMTLELDSIAATYNSLY